jgi:hypothetical protein
MCIDIVTDNQVGLFVVITKLLCQGGAEKFTQNRDAFFFCCFGCAVCGLDTKAGNVAGDEVF